MQFFNLKMWLYISQVKIWLYLTVLDFYLTMLLISCIVILFLHYFTQYFLCSTNLRLCSIKKKKKKKKKYIYIYIYINKNNSTVFSSDMSVCRGVINISYNANQFSSPGVSLMYVQVIHIFSKDTAVWHYHILPYQPLTCVVKRRSIWCWNRPSEALSWNDQTLHDPYTQTASRLKATVYPGLGFSLSAGVLRNTWPLMRK